MALEHFFPYQNKIHKHPNFPCYDLDFNTLINPIQTLNCNLKKNESSIKQKFSIFTQKYNRDFSFVYTDASKSNGRIGFGVNIPNINLSFFSRLPGEISITKAENVAIYQAIKIIISKDIKKAIIFSDSLNAISKIKNPKISATDDSISLKTKNLILSAYKKGFDILISWIPGHSDIPGNVEADLLAKIGTGLNIPLAMLLDSQDDLNSIKEKLLLNLK
uniref:ribonuclease H n=1 Tax=Diabrotica virgifera virgifera TaxID=50390 RepID=A0A6P7H241_DIAVI